MPGRILVLNLGSTSYKFKLFDFSSGEAPLASGHVERIGEAQSSWSFEKDGAARQSGSCACACHEDAFDFCSSLLTGRGTLDSMELLDGIAFKAVHGGPTRGAKLVDGKLLEIIESFSPFAPAHNPVYARLMRRLLEKRPGLKQVACFETSFHSDIPLCRAIYGVPYEWIERYGIRRYGFHGASHSCIAGMMRELSPKARKVISLHLGGSSSICAISDGRSIASSMGATPQSGLFQNNRVGDFDAFCIPRLAEAKGGQLPDVMRDLATKSGFLGISGVSNDLREVVWASEEGNARAKLAIDAFIDNCVGCIGMFTAYLQGLDALAFTGGIGQNCALIRNGICERLAYMGVRLDAAKSEGLLSAPDSRVQVWALETNEELVVARQAAALLAESK